MLGVQREEAEAAKGMGRGQRKWVVERIALLGAVLRLQFSCCICCAIAAAKCEASSSSSSSSTCSTCSGMPNESWHVQRTRCRCSSRLQ